MTEQLFLAYGKVTLICSALIGLLLLLSPLLRSRYPAQWQHLVWLVLTVRLVLPYQITLPKAPIRIAVPQQGAAFVLPQAGAAAVAEAGSSPPTAMAAGLSATAVLAAVWLAGCIVFLALQWGSYLVFLHRVRGAEIRPVPAWMQELWRERGQKRRILRLPGLHITGAVEAPVLAGLLRPRLYLPLKAEDYPPEDLGLIMRHELIHHRRGDLWFKLLLLAAGAIHWYNPLVHLMVGRAGKDIELSCDDVVIRDIGEGAVVQYSDTIVAHLPRAKGGMRLMMTTQFGSTKKGVKQRLVNLFDRRSKRRGVLSILAVAGVACIATGMITYTPAYAADKTEGTTAEYFAAYYDYGLAYDSDTDTLAYQGQPVKLFVSYRSGNSFDYLNCFRQAEGDLCLEGLRHATGQASGVRELEPEKARELLADLLPEDEPAAVSGAAAPEKRTEFVTYQATSTIGSLDLTATDLGLAMSDLPSSVRGWLTDCDAADTGAYIFTHEAGGQVESYFYYNGGGSYPWNIVNDGDSLVLSLFSDRMRGNEGYTLIRYTAPHNYTSLTAAVDGSTIPLSRTDTV